MTDNRSSLSELNTDSGKLCLRDPDGYLILQSSPLRTLKDFCYLQLCIKAEDIVTTVHKVVDDDIDCHTLQGLDPAEPFRIPCPEQSQPTKGCPSRSARRKAAKRALKRQGLIPSSKYTSHRKSKTIERELGGTTNSTAVLEEKPSLLSSSPDIAAALYSSLPKLSNPQDYVGCTIGYQVLELDQEGMQPIVGGPRFGVLVDFFPESNSMRIRHEMSNEEEDLVVENVQSVVEMRLLRKGSVK